MKQKFLNLLLKISNKALQLHNQLSDKVPLNFDYSSLSPIDDGDEKGHYSNALNWALINRKKKDIKNIALTGPYGSGKSTILKTFQKNYSGNDLKFLNISLATFKEEKIKRDQNGNIIPKEKEDRLRLIETSILQQIFYHEEDEDIPDSRFKKIKSYSKRGLLLISFGTLIFILSILNFTYPNLLLGNLEDITLPEIIVKILHYTSIAIILSGILFIIFKSVRIISSITINKLKFQNAEIEIVESPNKSILNHHLDEILYFFSVTPYNIVIIEDLDRFQETEIFTKLREINLLLNNSKKTQEKGIVFIYAVRDDMFSDNERIKFFDFIIPVIPVINSSNSSEILLRKKKKYDYNLSEGFIENLSFFIDDMRLLHNVTNEFYLYKQKHGETPLNQEKLFAIIAYKNIYPNDFVKLSKNKGSLYKILNSKNSFINEELRKIYLNIDQIKEELNTLERLSIKNIKELRLIYIARILEEMQGVQGFQSYVINDKEVSINDLLKDENFEYIKNNEIKYKRQDKDVYGRITYPIKTLPIQFSDVENKVDSTKVYHEREKEISGFISDKMISLRKKIQELEKEKIRKRNLKIADLISLNFDLNFQIDPKIDTDFVTILVRNGYIAEDYLDYISLFHGESITRSDHQFLISIRNKQILEFDYKLTRIEKIVSKLNVVDFNSDYILNFDLINFILENTTRYSNQIDFIFTKLKDESQRSLEFIDGFFERNEHISLFTKYLSKYWIGLWNYYVNDIKYADDQIRLILKYLILYSELDDLKIQAKNSTLKKNILSDQNFLLLAEDTQKTINVIQALGLKFQNINFKDSPDELLNYVYENDWYELNIRNIISLLKRYGHFDQITFDNSNYKSIKESKADKLISKIENDINFYLENIYFQIGSNINEDQKFLIDLLNNNEVILSNKQKLIKQITTKIEDLDSIIDKEVKEELLINDKLNPTWYNLLIAYKFSEDKISNSMLEFINHSKNAQLLSETKIPNEGDKKKDFGPFTRALLKDNRIENDSYEYLTKSVPWWYKDLEMDDLDNEKVAHLVNNSVLQPEPENFKSLKKEHRPLNIRLLEKFKNRYFKKLDELDFDGNDVEDILKSNEFNHLEKNTLLNSCSNEVITSNLDNLEIISSLLVQHGNFEVNKPLIIIILLSKTVSISNRIKIYNARLEKQSKEFIDKFLISLGKEYENITLRDKRAKIQKNSYNELLLQTLVKQKYISSFSNTIMGLRVNHWRKR
ncbi:YobI family P-loop NTPase [Salegentibacter sp. HM20]